MHTTPLTRLFAYATVFAAAVAAAPAVLAQTESTQRSRAEVKQEARAAMLVGAIVSGEATPTERLAPATSVKSREQRKAETMEARGRGELVHAGIATYRSSISQQTATAKSTKTRAERKAETMEAIHQHKTMQPGEAA